MMDGWYGAGWMAGGWFWMTLATVAFFLLVAWAARSLSGADNSRRSLPDLPQQPSALETLDIRFAKGEISEDEYKNMRRTLTGA